MHIIRFPALDAGRRDDLPLGVYIGLLPVQACVDRIEGRR